MDVHIVAGKRTPIGKFLGAFSAVSAVQLAVQVVQSLLVETQIPASDVEQVILGNARQAGNGPNPARQVAFHSGLSPTATAYTINMACASGLKAISLGAQEIRNGNRHVLIVGGTENMSQVPFLLPEFRQGYRLNHRPLVDGMYQDGFHCPLADQLMGRTAETLAEKYEISRQEQEAFALQSQKKCTQAQKENRFTPEITPISIRSSKSTQQITLDEHPRSDTTLEQLQKLPAIFKEQGSVHAGNASGITDGAAALLLVSETYRQAHGLKSLAQIDDYTEVGVDPKIMGIGPVPAVQLLLKRSGKQIHDFPLIELNEAFAAQVLACQRELHFKEEVLNVNGGSIALGHPIGATGSRIVVTLLHEMQRTEQPLGLATLCVSGGLGVALSLRRK
jgi:acetyl-CoA C-acetyltransferase